MVHELTMCDCCHNYVLRVETYMVNDITTMICRDCRRNHIRLQTWGLKVESEGKVSSTTNLEI